MHRVHSLYLTRDAHDFIRRLEPKQFKQVMSKVLSLLLEPLPADSSALKGYEDLKRVDQGEYRIVYRFDEKSVFVLIAGKRNDDQVYRALGIKNL
jgi:mRNA interferase RelE/StbE